MIRLPVLSPLEHAAFVAAGLLTYVVVTRVRRQRRHPYAALAWVRLTLAPLSRARTALRARRSRVR